MNIERRYYACRGCGQTYTPWDAWAGVGAIQVTEHARKMIVTVSTAWSFDNASEKLADVCSMNVSDDTIERVCQDEGEQARKWLRGDERPCESPGGNALVKAFEQAAGEPEFYSDGLKINTTGGWREMRLNLLQKRQRATPVTPERWKERVLSQASVRLASCAVADSRLTGAMWKQWSRRMGLEESAELSVLADGAPWIWEQAQRRLSPAAQWCVDVYHVSEHLHGCAKAMYGEGSVARSWAEQRLEELIQLAGPRFIAQLDQRINSCTQSEHVAAMKSLRTYLHGNRDRMWYAKRLSEGKPIGSGAIEGACKKIGTRLKLNSARWRPRRAERFGALLCLEYTDQMRTYWRSRAA
ncbi:MAG: hypothetical protein JWP03_1370 [Phycisphaerales bacterium]|nr:hypothetical protein [Phycisphaerales bacterium]